MRIKVNGLNQTMKLANNFAAELKGGEVVLLNGDLGAGKTTFTQYVFKALGVKDIVSSPTFAILKTYQGEKFRLHHFDTYRITTEEAIESGFDEVFQEKNSIIFVEWSENVASLLPNNTISVNIRRISEKEREFEILK